MQWTEMRTQVLEYSWVGTLVDIRQLAVPIKTSHFLTTWKVRDHFRALVVGCQGIILRGKRPRHLDSM